MRTINIRGNPFYLHDNEDVSNAMVRDNDYFEDHILDYIRSLYPDQKAIIDIGAMIGNHTQYFARFLTYSQIIAFEPIQENFKFLTLNTEEYPYIIRYNKALSNYNGKVTLEKNKQNWGMHGVQYPPDLTWNTGAYDPESREEVECITLDSLELQDVTLIKIDVELYEPQVLEGAAQTIARCKPLIVIEDVFQRYSSLPQLQGYTQTMGWEVDFTYIYNWNEG
jgi:FkbM family methyltransferase